MKLTYLLLALSLNASAASLLSKITIGTRIVGIVSGDPSSTGLSASTGSIVFANTGTDGWQKSGAGATAWDKLGSSAANLKATVALDNVSTTDVSASLNFANTITGDLITQKARTTSGVGNSFVIFAQDANGTNQRGGNVVLKAGRDTGAVSGGNWRQGPELEFWTNNSTTSGSSLATHEKYLRLTPTLLQGVDFQVGTTANGYFLFQSLVDSGTPGVSGDTSRILFGHASRGGMIKSVIQGITNNAGNGGDIVLKPGIGSSQDGNITCYGVGFVLPKLASAPSGAVSGTMYYDTTTNKSYTFDGSTWQAHF